MRKALVLDVGCGLHPRGDVNIDPYIDSIHRRKGKGPELNPEEIQSFLQVDGRNMPMFHDRMFHTVKCYHVIEHVPDWWVLLREMYRVTDKHLIIVTPHRRWLRFPNLKRSEVHVSNFDAKTWEKAIPKVLGTMNFEVETIYRGMFNKLLPFPLWPYCVRVDVYR